MGDYFNRIDNHLSNKDNRMPIRDDSELVNTFLGNMPRNGSFKMMEEYRDPQMINDMISAAIGGPGMKMVGKTIPAAAPLIKEGAKKGMEMVSDVIPLSVKEGAKKGYNYLHPEKAAEEFRGQFGQGTSKENVEKIGEKVKSSYENKLKEALQPKEELFKIHKDTKIVPKSTENHYWQDSDASQFYNKGSTLLEKHKNYIKKPTLENYDELQSALKKEQRRLETNPHLATDEKLNQIKLNIKNLDKDVTLWAEKLPENEKNLEKTWRSLYKKNVVPYIDKKTPIALRNLVEGKSDQVTSAQIGNLFTRMTKETKKIFNDLPPDVSKNIIYNAMQKVNPGDAEEMAKTIIDLKRTKGYDKFITKEMEDWAYNMQKQVSRATLIKDALKLTGGAATGGVVGGPLGAVVGAALPFAKEFGKEGFGKLVKKLKK